MGSRHKGMAKSSLPAENLIELLLKILVLILQIVAHSLFRGGFGHISVIGDSHKHLLVFIGFDAIALNDTDCAADALRDRYLGPNLPGEILLREFKRLHLGRVIVLGDAHSFAHQIFGVHIFVIFHLHEI